MQFSKKVVQAARLYNIEPKDVLFSYLIAQGAEASEAFAVIYRSTTTTDAGLQKKAANYIAQRPGLKKLITALEDDRTAVPPSMSEPEPPAPALDYSDKDAVLRALVDIAERGENENVRLSALREVASLQRMKAEVATAEEKRVHFYIPLSYRRCEELCNYLQRLYADL